MTTIELMTYLHSVIEHLTNDFQITPKWDTALVIAKLWGAKRDILIVARGKDSR